MSYQGPSGEHEINVPINVDKKLWDEWKKEASKDYETKDTIIPDTSKIDKARREAEKPIKTEAEIKYKETKIPLMGEVKLPSNLDKKTLSDAKAYAKALESAISNATTNVTKKNLTQLGKNANVKDFMSQYPELASTSELDSRVRGGITSFINKNKISSEYQEQIAELFRIGNIIKKINESYSSKSGLFKAEEYETLDEMLAARQRQADVLAYHDRLVEQFNKNNTPDNLGGHQVATRNYFTKKNSELIPGFNTSVTEEVSQKALIGDIKTSLEAGGEGIATVFITAAKSIGAGSKEVIDALKSVQTGLTAQAKDAGKRDILDTKNRELSNAKDKILEAIEKNDAKTSRATLNRYRREHDFQNEDLSPTVQAGILGNLLVYKYKGGTGLKDLQDFDDVKNLIFEQDTTGFFKKIYEEQSAKLFLEQQDAEKKAVSSFAPKTTTPKKKSTSKSTSSKPKTTQKKSTQSTTPTQNITSKGSVYDSIVNADYSATGKKNAAIKFMAASRDLDQIRENPDIPQGSFSETAALYKTRKYYITALKNGIPAEALNLHSPYVNQNTNLKDAESELKGLEQRLSIFSQIYDQINNFDGTLLSHDSIRNAADKLVNQMFAQNIKKNNGNLSIADLDKTERYEERLLGKIRKKSGKDTKGLYFLSDTHYALRDSLEDTSTSSKSPTTQAKKTEKTADAVDTAVDHINDAVASAADNATENIDQMADSTKRLGVATEDTAKKQEESVKQEERKYKVTSAPKLKVSTDTAQSKSDREEQRVRIIQAKKNAQAAENEQSFIAHKENFLTGYKSGNLLGSTYNGFKLSPEKLLGFLEQDNPYKNYRLVSNKEDINGRKKTTVYKDDQTGRSYTRTLTKDSDGLWRQSGGDIKSGYAALETEAINIEKRLMTEREDLADMEAGIAKNSSQSNIKASKKRIGYLKGRMKSLRADAETYAQEHPEYTTEQFDEAIQKGIEQHRIDMNERAGNRISDQIISEYTDLMNGLSKLEKKNKELSSAKSKGASNELINNLRKEIDNKQKNIEDADKFIEQHSDVLGKDRVNAYNTQKSKLGEAEQGAYSAFQKENTQKNIDDYNQTYDSAIAKVKELKQAYVDLYNIQANGASGKYGKDEYIEKVNAQVDKIKSLRKEVGDFYNTVYDNNKSNPDRILDQKKFDSYQKAFDDMSDYSNFDGKNNNIIELMKKAYSNKRNNENKLLGLATKDGADITAGKILGENYTNAYQSLRAQVNSIFGKEVAENAIFDIRNRANATQDQLISNNSKSFLNQVDSYLTKLESAGRITDRLKADLESIKTSTKDAESAFNQNKNANGILDYVDKIQEQTEKFTDLKNYYENTVTGNDELNFAEQINKLNKFANSGNKIDAYKDKITEFRTRYNQLVDSLNNKEIDENNFHDSVNNIISDIENFQKTASGYDRKNGKGILQEGTLGTIKDIDDATSALRNYASQLGLTNEVSTSINKSTGSISLVFKDVSGNLVTLTGNIEKANDSLRTMEKYTNKSGTSGFTSLSDSLKGLVKGNFTSALGDVANAVGSIQIMQQAWQQMREGFNTFMDYDKALTTISYTMDMNKQQLSDLGTSAVDMAKDLSMSLDNTMDIYQIYANMNTTSKEIQETAKPTAILSNLSGVDASTAADQVQGILQQFHMLEDGSTSAADASMHVVDVMDKISSNVGMDYAKGIKVMSDAVQASGQVAYDAGMSYEQLAAISAKVAERTREDGSSIGNALKTIITRTTKVGKMPQYADEVDNATLSNASASLHSIGVDVYNPDGSDRGIVTVLSELKSKWNDLTDAQQAKIAFDVAATRQTSKFKNILDAFTDSMSLAEEATNAQGNAEANQEKYMESFNGKVQAIKTQMDEFWLNFYNSDQVGGALDFVHGLTEGFTGLEKTLGPIPALITAIFSAMTVKNAGKKGLDFLIGGGFKTAVG